MLPVLTGRPSLAGSSLSHRMRLPRSAGVGGQHQHHSPGPELLLYLAAFCLGFIKALDHKVTAHSWNFVLHPPTPAAAPDKEPQFNTAEPKLSSSHPCS